MPKSKKEKPIFMKVLDVSICHITENDNLFLQQYISDDICPRDIADLPEGYLCRVTCLLKQMEDLSEAFKKVISFAQESNAQYIMFDIDGQEYNNLIFCDG